MEYVYEQMELRFNNENRDAIKFKSKLIDILLDCLRDFGSKAICVIAPSLQPLDHKPQ